ncbi:response regulator [Elongatibacter sediminis]|uniref:Response regulator n=1 Tax=Elongatibacter sediminis TaxID=3119006 RepID=A0AAW9R4M1_9GAMM
MTLSMDVLKIIVVDDSSMAMNVAVDQLRSAGHDAEGVLGSEQALERIRAARPDFVISDVMMPGINGFELCRMIRADEDLAEVRVVMASAKPYEADRNKARRLGADGYIVKPFTVAKFDEILQSLGRMQLTAWGVRGTLPVPQEGFIEFGGNTSCYSLQFPGNRVLVFDAGSGIKNCGDSLLSGGNRHVDVDLFITHPHWDHINAFPFFKPLYIPGNVVRVHGVAQDEVGFEDLMVAQMDGMYFPVTVQEFGAQVTFHEIGEQTLDLGGITVRTMLLKHPGNCLGYRVDYQGRSFCYITDNELYPADSEYADEEFVERLADFCRVTDVLVHDCTYFDEEYETKVHWGHSRLSEVCRLAHLAGAKRLWIHHHDPDQSDRDIARKLDVCRLELERLESGTQAILPHEGQTEPV